jgi:hypothetical protein
VATTSESARKSGAGLHQFAFETTGFSLRQMVFWKTHFPGKKKRASEDPQLSLLRTRLWMIGGIVAPSFTCSLTPQLPNSGQCSQSKLLMSSQLNPPNDGSNSLPGWFSTCMIWSSDMVEKGSVSGHIICCSTAGA